MAQLLLQEHKNIRLAAQHPSNSGWQYVSVTSVYWHRILLVLVTLLLVWSITMTTYSLYEAYISLEDWSPWPSEWRTLHQAEAERLHLETSTRLRELIGYAMAWGFETSNSSFSDTTPSLSQHLHQLRAKYSNIWFCRGRFLLKPANWWILRGTASQQLWPN